MRRISAIFAAVCFAAALVSAQTTQFTYHGSLRDGTSPANGSYDFEFALYDGVGIQTGATQTRSGVAVANGVFTVSLDFGNQFPGGPRFLEIRVRPAGAGGFTTLTPRQPVNSAPYSVKSLNSDTAASAATATTFSGSLGGDVVGTQNATAIAGSAVTTAKLADGAVTSAKIANGQVVRSINGLTDGVTLSPGSNITITPNGSSLTIASTAGTVNAVLNQTAQQAGANFNIGGTGTANVFNAVSQYNINGAGRILSSPGSNNLFAGIGSGNANTSGGGNTFVGGGAGGSNTTGGTNVFVGANAGAFNNGSENSFVGAAAGFFNTTGIRNSFFGATAGQSNTVGNNNAFFGWTAGQASTGSNNSFFGARSGQSNTSGSENSFVGESAGRNNTSGVGNAFFGKDAGQNNTTGSSNSFFGKSAGLVTTTGSENSYFGANSGQFTSTGNQNTFVGTRAGYSNTDGAGNSFFGTDAGRSNTTGLNNAFFGNSAGHLTNSSDNVFIGVAAGYPNTSGAGNTIVGATAGQTNTVGDRITLIGQNADVTVNNLQYATAIGARSTVSTSNTVALGRANGSDAVVIYGIAGFGTFHLCLNSANQVAGCSSSLRYKSNIGSFSPGMSFINRLRPISFDWKDTGMHDVGFGAEDLEKIDPRFVTYNKAGQVEGVKYDRLSVAFVNAFREQQAQIDSQSSVITRQEKRIKSQEAEIADQQSANARQQKQIETLLRLNAAMNARLQAVERALKPKRKTNRR